MFIHRCTQLAESYAPFCKRIVLLTFSPQYFGNGNVRRRIFIIQLFYVPILYDRFVISMRIYIRFREFAEILRAGGLLQFGRQKIFRIARRLSAAV